MECRHEAGHVMNGGYKMAIQPGQVVGAVSWLAHRWNWTPMTVRGWLTKLEADGMIERYSPGSDTENNKQVGKQSTVISVCNYDRYQVIDESFHVSKQQANNTQTTSSQHADNNNIRKTREQGDTKNIPHSPLPGGADQSQLDIEKLIADRLAAALEQTRSSSSFAPQARELQLMDSGAPQSRI